MAAWKYQIKLKEEWKKALSGELHPVELAEAVAEKGRGLQILEEFEDDGELEFILGRMDSFLSSELSDFDDIMDKLYDWADSNLIWIATF